MSRNINSFALPSFSTSAVALLLLSFFAISSSAHAQRRTSRASRSAASSTTTATSRRGSTVSSQNGSASETLASSQTTSQTGSTSQPASSTRVSRSQTSDATSVQSQRISFGGEIALPYSFGTLKTLSMSGVGFHIGGVVDLPIGNGTGIVAAASYESKSQHGSVTEQGVTLNMGITLNYYGVSALVRHDLSKTMMLQGGMAVQMGASGSHVDATIEAGGKHVDGNKAGELTVPTQIALVAGAGYRVPLSASMELIPNASFNYFLTSPSPDGGSHFNTITVGARLMFR